MITSGAYNYINVLSKATKASSIRQDVLSNNLANVDTPNYKRQDVNFESAFKEALNSSSNLDQAVSNMNLDTINGSVYTDSSSLSYRLDGNNVDVDNESAYLAENQIRYYTLLDSISQEFNRLKIVLK